MLMRLGAEQRSTSWHLPLALPTFRQQPTGIISLPRHRQTSMKSPSMSQAWQPMPMCISAFIALMKAVLCSTTCSPTTTPMSISLPTTTTRPLLLPTMVRHRATETPRASTFRTMLTIRHTPSRQTILRRPHPRRRLFPLTRIPIRADRRSSM